MGQGEAPEMGLRYSGKYNGTTLNTYIQLFETLYTVPFTQTLVQTTCISCKFSINKTEAISANCDFIVFTAELLQYSTESHEIKLL